MLRVISQEFDDFPPLVERHVERVGVEEELAVVLVRLLGHLIDGHPAHQVLAHLDGDAGRVPLRGPGQLPHRLVRPVPAFRHAEQDVDHVPLELAVHELGPGPETCQTLAVLRLVVANVEKVLVEIAVVNDYVVRVVRLVRVRHRHVFISRVFGTERGGKSECFHDGKLVGKQKNHATCGRVASSDGSAGYLSSLSRAAMAFAFCCLVSFLSSTRLRVW